ncbi:hypothetical protein K2X96_03180 [Patescibacteria group bacterium]|nr:hypothetical protein [Patescibacteria group bacterium]
MNASSGSYKNYFLWLYLFSIALVCVGAFTSIVSAETEDELRARLATIEEQIARQQVLLDGKQQERQSLERDVAILDAKIKKAQLAIQARDIEITRLGGQIGDKEETVGVLTDRSEKQRQSLAELIRKTNEIDDYSLVEILLGTQSISEFFQDLENFQIIKESLYTSLNDLASTRELTLQEKSSLEIKQQSEKELRALQALEKKEIEANERAKAKILAETKGTEAEYQRLLRAQQKTASEIRAQLFKLRDSGSIPFMDAIEYAEFASAKTGVRAALIMGVLTQETNLGSFLGVMGGWQTEMHPTRDKPVFEVIMKELGLDPDSVPVSGKPSYGWGGAMGPSQFIPSTWAMYGGFVSDGAGGWMYDASKDRIRQVMGKSSPSNPYEKQDAFVATGLLMGDNGAVAQTYAAERLAALRYFAGWGNANNPAYAFYGDGVMGHTTRIQEEINILKGT